MSTKQDAPPIELLVSASLGYMVAPTSPVLAEVYKTQKEALQVKKDRVTAIHTQLKAAIETMEQNTPVENNVTQNPLE